MSNSSIPSFPLHTCAIPVDLASPHSTAALQKKLIKSKASFTGVEKWEFNHYRESGFLGWIARLILLIMPSLQSRFDQLERLEIALKQMRRAAHLEATAKVATAELKLDSKQAAPTPASSQPAIPAAVQDALPHPVIVPAITPSIALALEGKKSSSQLSNADGSHCPSSVKADTHSLLRHPISCPANAASLSEQAQADREIALANIKKCHYFYNLPAISDELRGNRAFMLEAVAIHGYTLQYASPELKSD